MKPALLDSLLAFAQHFGVTLYDWQREAFGTACARVDGRFTYRLAGISVPRGNGKSFAGAVVGLWRLLAGGAPQDVISAALDYDGAKVVLDHARRIVRGSKALARAVEIQAGGLVVPSTGSRWSITSREHTASRGRHPTLVLFDEAGWSRDDELFGSLLAGQASVEDPLCLVISTVGRRQSGPLWTVKALADGGDEGVYWYWNGDNLSPKVTAKFLERQRRILVPAQFAREHGNQWVDAADSFTTSEQVDRAMQQGWREQSEGPAVGQYHAFVDIGLVHDPSVIAVAHAEGGLIYLDRLLTFQGSRAVPVRISTLEAALVDLAQQFNLTCIRVESWQGAGVAQSLQRLGLPVSLFAPTPKSNAEEWPQLQQRLANGTLVLFPHVRLREELLGLTVEIGATGAKVIDRGGAHQDHAVALRGVVASLGAGYGEGVIGVANLSHDARVRSALSDADREEIRGYEREQREWARDEFRRDLELAGDGPSEAAYGSGWAPRRWYAARRRTARDSPRAGSWGRIQLYDADSWRATSHTRHWSRSRWPGSHRSPRSPRCTRQSCMCRLCRLLSHSLAGRRYFRHSTAAPRRRMVQSSSYYSWSW